MNSDKKASFQLPQILEIYKNEPFDIQMKVRFILYVNIAIILSLVFILAISSYKHLTTPSGIYFYKIEVEAVFLVLFLFCISFLKRGLYNFTAHLLAILSLIAIWTMMIIDEGDTLSRLNTITYVLAILTITPIIVTRNKQQILLYGIINIAIVYIFIFYFKSELNISVYAMIDYLADVTISIFFVAFISYNNFNISNFSLNKALEDIKERKRVEKTLSTTQRFQRKIFESSSIPSVVMNADTLEFIDCNSASIEIYGFTKREDLIGKTPMNVSAKTQYDESPSEKKIAHYVERVLFEGNVIFEWLHQRPDGELWDGEVHLLAFEIGTNRYIQFSIIDITERKQTEKEVINYREHLESLVNMRTDELQKTNETLVKKQYELQDTITKLNQTQEQLIHSEKMASLGVLVAGIAHEINNPLNFINGSAWGLETYFEDHLKDKLPEVKPLFDALHVGVDRATNIVNGLRQYSATIHPDFTDCNINTIIDQCLVMLNNQLIDKTIIRKNYTTQSYRLKGNEGRLQQLFLNILKNAEQAIPNIGRIDITTAIEEEYMVITIKDSGIGIKPDIMDKIIEPFFTTKPSEKGTGLGLSIADNIVKEHSGIMHFESEEDNGTKVIIKLPTVH